MIAGCCALEMFPDLGVPVCDFLRVDFWVRGDGIR